MTPFDVALVYLTVFGAVAIVLYALSRFLRQAGSQLGTRESRLAD